MTMGRVEELAARYEEHIKIPWQPLLSGGQRVLMVVYEKEMERSFRARKAEFEQRTRNHGLEWTEFDCTKHFAQWMAREDYREAYFESPDDLVLKLEMSFLESVSAPLRNRLAQGHDRTVVALTGLGSLFGFTRVSDLVRSVESAIPGRLAVFFPGTRDGTTYRLLDARDGWNYLAPCITLHGAGVPA